MSLEVTLITYISAWKTMYVLGNLRDPKISRSSENI